MLKPSRFFIIPVLLIVALLLAGSSGVLAKMDPPQQDPRAATVGPVAQGQMRFFFLNGDEESITCDSPLSDQVVEFDGRCGGVPIFGYLCIDWAKDDGTLSETDLVCHGPNCQECGEESPPDCNENVFEQRVDVGDDPDDNAILTGLKDCYDTEAQVIIMQFKNVHNFSYDMDNNEYSAGVVLLREIVR